MSPTEKLLTQYLELPERHTERAREDLLTLTTTRVLELLNHDMAHLMNSLYRIDVNEGRVNAAFGLGSPETIAAEIARLMLERIEEKVAFRRQFSEKP